MNAVLGKQCGTVATKASETRSVIIWKLAEFVVPLKLPEFDQVFEAAGEVRRAAPGEVPMNRLNAR